MTPRALGIDFARRRPRPAAAGYVLLAAGALLAAAAVEAYIDRDARLAAAELQRASLQRRLDGAPRGAALDAETRRLMAGAARLAEELRRPWQRLFADIEGAIDDSVALLVVEPDAARRQLRLAAEARTLADALALAARLDASASLANARIVQQEARASEGVAALGFSIVADWETGP